uniref:Uncharacterized protein n=1 Tax=Arundo donax TaxID=35708 RepID=A0A0A9FNJ5_ARUDO
MKLLRGRRVVLGSKTYLTHNSGPKSQCTAEFLNKLT